jgi:type IV pilus assembly protein PilX
MSPDSTMSHINPLYLHGAPRLKCKKPARAQAGVVLIIALIMLVVISLLATLSIRNSASSESTSGNVRTTELATQAAEIALRYCEDAVQQMAAGGTITFATTLTIHAYQNPPRWKDNTNWDTPATPPLAFTIPSSSVNQSTAMVTFKRMPECMVERIPSADSTGTFSTTSTYVITARGFGPEVVDAVTEPGRPKGSEVWLQSTFEP